MIKNILIIGGTGFLGSALAKELSTDYNVTLFDWRRPIDCSLKYICGDFFNLESSALEDALEGIDCVFHFISATVPVNSKSVQFEIDYNLVATVNLLDLMVKKEVAHICYPSSGGTVYGDSLGSSNENSKLNPGCPYGLGKVLIENTIQYYAHTKNIKYQIYRISNPYGNLRPIVKKQGVIESFIQQIKENNCIELWSPDDTTRDFIYIDDVTSAIKSALTKSIYKNLFWNETFNVSTGKGTTLLEILRILENHFDSNIVINKHKGFTGPRTSIISSDKLQSFTDWSPQYSIQKGIAKLLENQND